MDEAQKKFTLIIYLFIFFIRMTHTKNNRLGTYTMTLPEFQEIFRGNLRRPPTSSVEVYQWKCRSSKHSLTKLLSLWLPIFFLWCDPFTFASALPLPPATAEGILSTESDVTLYNDYLLADGKLDHVGLNGATDDFQDETQVKKIINHSFPLSHVFKLSGSILVPLPWKN